MRGIARVGDKCRGVCTAHKTPIVVEGIIITGSPNSFINGRQVARIGDTVLSNCGHKGTIITGEPTAMFNARPHARIADQFVGTYSGIIISASPDGY